MKILTFIFLALVFSCSNEKLDKSNSKTELSLKDLVKREVLANNTVSPYRFEIQNKKNSIQKNSNLGVALSFPKTKIRPYRIQKKLFTNSQTNSLIKVDVDKFTPYSGKLLEISEQNKQNYELNMNKSFKQYGFKVESNVKSESMVSLIKNINWEAPHEAQKIADAQRSKIELENKNAVDKKDAEVSAVEGLGISERELDTVVNNYLDEKSTAIVATEAGQKNIATQSKSSDDLVLIDMKEENITNDDVTVQDEVSSIMAVAQRSISSSVTDVIRRELNNKNSKKRNNKKQKKNNFLASLQNAPILPEESIVPRTVGGCGSRNGTMSIHAYSVELGVKKQGKAFNFDLISEYNKNEIFADSGQGCVELPVSIQRGSLYRGAFSSKDGILTKSDIFIDGEEFHVPLVSKTSLVKFLDEKKDFNPGSFILIELAENINSVEVASKYGRKYFFDEFFKETDTEDFHYVLFTGVTPGNVTIQYLTNDDQIVDKISHVTVDEIYYDMARIEPAKSDRFYLFEDGLFSKNKRLLVEGSDIRYFNSNIKATQKALNLYEIQVPPSARGMRKYFELGHMGEVIVMGKTNQDKVTLPTRRLIGQILTELSLDDLSGRCLVQINTRKSVKSFEVEGEGRRGIMNINYQYLDAEGNFGRFESDTIKRIFVTGEDQGVINAKINYFDGKNETIQTYCSSETYLVEQL